MQIHFRLVAFPLGLALLATTSTAGDLFVAPPGGGAAFTEVSAALAAANPGDTIHVAAGTYDVFTVDLPVTVVGAGSALVSIQSSVPGVGVEVRDIAAGTEAVLSGMTFLEASGGTAPFVRVANNDGGVVLHDLAGSGTPGGAFVHDLVSVTDSAQVVLGRCSFTGEDANSALGGVPLLVDGSQVWVAQSSLVAGASQLNGLSMEVLEGTAGIEVKGGGTVYVASSFVHGGLSGSWFGFGAEFPGLGGAGIYLQAGAAILSGGPGNTIRGGDANPAGPFGSRAGNGILPTFAGYAEYATDVVLEGGLELSGFFATPLAAAFDWSYLAQPYARPVLGTSVAQVAPGGSFDLAFSGNPLSPVATVVSLGTGAFLPLGGVDGPLVVDLSSIFIGPATTLDAGGLAAASVPVPAQPALAGTLVVFQSVELATAVTALSNPALIVIES